MWCRLFQLLQTEVHWWSVKDLIIDSLIFVLIDKMHQDLIWLINQQILGKYFLT